MKSGYDLIVVGAGMIGVACADAAVRAGLAVTVVESGIPGAGVTASSMGHLVAVDGDPAELALAGYSQRLWREDLCHLPNIDYRRCGTVWIAASEADLERVPGMCERLAAAGVATEVVDAPTLYRLEPNLAPGLAGGVLAPEEGIVYPPAAVRALLDRARQAGARLRRARVTALHDHGVTLEDGSRLEGQVLLATGSALPELLPELPLRPRRGHLVITDRHPDFIHHQLVQLHYADSAHGEADSVAFNIQPRPTGQLLIGSSREYGARDTSISMPMVQRMLARTFEFLPALTRVHAIRIWAGLRPASPDGLPYIGQVPGRPGTWVAACHEGLGICTAPGTARLLLDLLQGCEPELDPAPYAPVRVLS